MHCTPWRRKVFNCSAFDKFAIIPREFTTSCNSRANYTFSSSRASAVKWAKWNNEIKPRRDETTCQVSNRNKETTTPGRRDDGTKQRSDTRKRRNDESNMSSTICLPRSREQLGLSVRKRHVMWSVRVTQAIRSLKKLLSARTARAVRWKQLSPDPFKRLGLSTHAAKKVLKIGHKFV